MARSSRSRYCDDGECRRARERQRKRRRSGSSSAGTPKSKPPAIPPGSSPVPSLVEVTRRVLEEAKRADSPAGVNALALAARIDAPQFDTAAGLAALSKQHLAALAVALDGAARTGVDPLDEVKAMREKRQREAKARG
ncbi:MAG TPA: hypothetical protein VM345_17880 [Acidimicrobiales bacterium]|nr:hypothetical protein [Acidimicrobiales bacterium]